MSAPVYDASEWSPGDVALVRWGAVRSRQEDHLVRNSSNDGWVGPWITDLSDDDAEIEWVRRLAVIDPEDAEQVRALGNAWDDLADQHATLTNEPMTLSALRMQAALRAFANPTPPIEEPQGLGVVVNDRDGDVWVKHSNGSWSCLMGPVGADVRTWDELCDQYGPISPGVVTP